MAKRFHDNEIWSQDWFLDMPTEYQMFWFWVMDKCDHAGIWKPNTKSFERTTGMKVNLSEALKLFNSEKERITITHQKKNWFILDYFVFQYGTTFNISNKVHKSIYSVYNQEDINLRSIRGLKEVKLGSSSGQVEDYLTLKDKDKEKDKDIKSLRKGLGNHQENGRGQVDPTKTPLTPRDIQKL